MSESGRDGWGEGTPDALLARLGAVADPTRLRLLLLLTDQELGVVALADVLQTPQSTVSRHLKVLGEQGWVVSRRQGTTHFYRLSESAESGEHADVWSLLRDAASRWATAGQDRLRLRRLLSDRPGGAQAFFAEQASHWDALREEYYGEAFWLEAVAAMIDPSAVVADIGCGTGTLTARLAPYVAEVIGIDASPPMLAAAATRCGQLTNVRLSLGDFYDLPLEDRRVDLAVVAFGLSYAERPGAALREVARVLRSNGRVTVVDLLSHDRDDFRRAMGQRHRGFDEVTLRGLFTDAGFGHVSVLPLPPEPRAKGPALFVGSARVQLSQKPDAADHVED